MTDTRPRAYCPTCRRSQPVEGTHTEAGRSAFGPQAALVTDLACGHEAISGQHQLPTADGAPYAGPDLAGRVTAVDPWNLAGMA